MNQLVISLVKAASKVRTSRGVTNVVAKALPDEIGVLFGGIKTAGADIVEVTHRFRNTGKSPYCVLDCKVKDKEGKLLDRIIGSISDWSSNGRGYTVKSRKPSLETIVEKVEVEDKAVKIVKDSEKTSKVGRDKAKEIKDEFSDKWRNDKKPKKEEVVHQPKLPFDETADDVVKDKVKDIKPEKPKFPEKPMKEEVVYQPKLPFDETADDVVKDKVKDIKPEKPMKEEVVHQPKLPFDESKDEISKKVLKDKKGLKDEKPIPGVLPPKPEIIKVEGGIVEHETQFIPNIRDFELDALYDNDGNTRLNALCELSKTGRQVLFDPKTGKPNVFWTFNREEAMDYFLRLIGRK